MSLLLGDVEPSLPKTKQKSTGGPAKKKKGKKSNRNVVDQSDEAEDEDEDEERVKETIVRDLVHPQLSRPLAEVAVNLQWAGMMILEGFQNQTQGTCRIPEHKRFFDGQPMVLGAVDKHAKEVNPDHRLPFRSLNNLTQLLLTHWPLGTSFTGRDGLSQLMSFHGFGMGYGTRNHLGTLPRPFTKEGLLQSLTGDHVDMNAWGQTCAQLSLNHKSKSLEEKLEGYWRDELQEGWLDFLKRFHMDGADVTQWEGTLPTIADFDKFFKGNRKLGYCFAQDTLTRLQMMNSMVCLGLLKSLGEVEMAQWVGQHGKGAKDGLIRLGFYCGTPEDTALAFRIVHRYFDASLTKAEKDAVDFGPWSTEHILCKVKRWFRVGERKPWKLMTQMWYEAVRGQFTEWAPLSAENLAM